MIRLRPSGVDEILIKRVQDWYEPGPGVFITSTSTLFSPAMLFTGTTTGAWYDPSDTTTLFRDAAGTLPVTAVEQPVGRMLDKSGRGNHAFNPSGNSANFPVLSARYNLLTKTEDFSDAVWQKINSGSTNPSITSTGLSDALGGNTATRVVFGAITANSQYSLLKQDYFNASGSYTRSIYVKASTSGDVGKMLFMYSGVGDRITITLSNTWQRISGNASLSGTTQYAIATLGSDYGGGNQAAVSVDVCGADLRVANDALNQPAYQRVNTSTDYDTVGFKQGEVFDGINDYLTASAGGGSTTSFFWCSAIRVGKVGAVQTLFSDAGTNTGYRVRINASNQLELSAGNGTAYSTVSTTATLSIGQRAVLTAWHDGTNLNVQINNGTVHQVAFSTATAGTAQCTIGKDNNAASNFFAGWLYENVYTKDNVPSSAQIADTKAYVANIAGITL